MRCTLFVYINLYFRIHKDLMCIEKVRSRRPETRMLTGEIDFGLCHSMCRKRNMMFNKARDNKSRYSKAGTDVIVMLSSIRGVRRMER